MVYTASGQPLYLPPHARKQQNAAMVSYDAVQDNGMQSLLSAIELDMSKDRASMDLLSNQSLHSSFINSPDHQDLMDELLGTNFASDDGTNDIDLAHSAVQKDSSLDRATAGVLCEPLPARPDMMEEPSNVRRSWEGLHEKWQQEEHRLARIKSVIEENIEALSKPDAVDFSQETSRLTRITFSWPAVAQKSYGTEKRLLNPAPMCMVSGYHHRQAQGNPLTHLWIFPSDESKKVQPQSQFVGRDSKVSYKMVHINNDNIGKSKSVTFKLVISRDNDVDLLNTPLAEFMTPPIVLLSKPSKRTSRLKLQSSFLYEGDTISLFNRINSQTVRTKYLTHKSGQLSVQADSWTPFRITLYQLDHPNPEYIRPLLYGATVVLTDVRTGFSSPPMIIRRLDGKRIVDDTSGNVSQMQKLILERVIAENTSNPASELGVTQRTFLSARNAQEQAKTSTRQSIPLTSFEAYPSIAGSIEPADMDDYGQWTVVGVGSSECTFLDTLADLPSPKLTSAVTSPNKSETTLKRKRDELEWMEETSNMTKSVIDNSIVIHSSKKEPVYSTIQLPITPFPTLLSQPIFLPDSNRLHLQIRDYWQTASALPPPSIFLGSCGPLVVTALQQSTTFPADAALEVELPHSDKVRAPVVPLLFVREDGIVSTAGCQISIATAIPS